MSQSLELLLRSQKRLLLDSSNRLNHYIWL
jgi:hypothetical protein